MVPKIKIYLRRPNWVEGERFIEGLKHHGINCDVHLPGKPVDKCDIAVINSPRFWQDVIKKQRADGNHYIILERGHVNNRFKWTSIGYNGLAGDGDYCIKNMPGDRWKAHEHLMEPWKNEGDYVLVIGQVPHDASLEGVDYRKWKEETMKFFHSTGVKAIYREHPGSQNITKYHTQSDFGLYEQLDGAYCVVTVSSTAGVNSILYGKPTIATNSKSMVYDICSHEIRRHRKPLILDRTQWAYDLAYCQWDEEEMIKGEFWEHLKNGPNGVFA